MRENVPETLADRRQWTVWRSVKKAGRKKPAKIPYNYKTSKEGSSTDPESWGTLEDVLKVAGDYDGIGIVFIEEDPLCGIDLDNCRDKKTGKIDTWAQEIIDDFDCYTEASPSGTGVHLLFESTFDHDGHNKGDIEIYSRGRFFTFTGQRVDFGSVADRTNKHKELYQKHARQKTTADLEDLDSDRSDMTADDARFFQQMDEWCQGVFVDWTTGGDDRSEVLFEFLTRILVDNNFDTAQAERIARASHIRTSDKQSRWNNATWFTKLRLAPALARAKEIAPPAADDFKDYADLDYRPEDKEIKPEDPDPIPLYDLEKFYTVEPPPREWLLEGLIPKGRVGSLVAHGGVGKSNLLNLMVRCMATGARIAPFKPGAPARILMINVEDEPEDVWRRLFAQQFKHIMTEEELLRIRSNLFIGGGPATLGPLMYKDRDVCKVNDAEARKLVEMIRRKRPDLTVLDTRSRLYGLPENDNDAAAQWLGFIEYLSGQYGTGFLISHHQEKSAEGHDSLGRGASAFGSNVRFSITLANMSEKESKRYKVHPESFFSMKTGKQNYGPKSREIYFEKFDEGVPVHVDLEALRYRAACSHAVATVMNPEINFNYTVRDLSRGVDKVSDPDGGADIKGFFKSEMKPYWRTERDDLTELLHLLVADERLEIKNLREGQSGTPKNVVGVTIPKKDPAHPNLFH